MINWNCPKEETKLIVKIAEKAMGLYPEITDHQSLLMDITACHLNGTPLDLEKFLNFNEGSFGHDIFGIMKYINRDNGKITKGFLPRCSK